MEYGTRIKDLLHDRDLKQKTLAEELNLTQSTLSNYITHRTDIPVETLLKIAVHLSVTTDYLLGLTDDPNPPFPLSAEERSMIMQFRSLAQEQKELVSQIMAFMGKQNRQER